MIVSGWQDVNIGDITHTPGLIGLLQQRLPGARLILWKKSESQKVDALLKKNYPALHIVHGQFDKDLVPQTDDVKKAFKEADFFIHGSGPSVVAADHLRSWSKLHIEIVVDAIGICKFISCSLVQRRYVTIKANGIF